jgi:ubiquinone/menaquinone biosynthesis C-methylase UbiE
VIEARGNRAAILRAYNFFRPFYGSWAALLERQAVARGLELAHVQSGERVLEVAAGTAAAFARLRQQAGPQGCVIGVDLTPGMLAATRRRVPAALLVRADARSLPFPADYFDLVWSSYLLDLIPTGELLALLVEFRRVLRAAGRLLLVNLSKKDEGVTWWERTYQLTPSWLVPYLFGGCRPIQAVPFVREAGFTEIGREFVSKGVGSEVIIARRPLCPSSSGINKPNL